MKNCLTLEHDDLPRTPASTPSAPKYDISKIGVMLVPESFKLNFFHKLEAYCETSDCDIVNMVYKPSPAEAKFFPGCSPSDAGGGLRAAKNQDPLLPLPIDFPSSAAAKLPFDEIPRSKVKLVKCSLDIWKLVAVFSSLGLALLLLLVASLYLSRKR